MTQPLPLCSQEALESGESMPRMADLADLGLDAPSRFGGKAAGLARLVAAGVSVPEGFAVEASEGSFAEWPEAARSEFRERANAMLVRDRLAVRSSAIGEDSGTRSFAGLFDTVLGVSDLAAAEAGAARCLASSRSERVRAYAAEAPLRMGLVVQRQVGARTAGVCFTVDPTGRDGAVVVEVVAGLGDVLVSGQVQPERWRVYRTGFGSVEVRRDSATPATASTAVEASEVAMGGAALAARLGFPLDLEWARDAEGRLWWLQARPITAAVSRRTFAIERFFEGVDDGPVTVWANWNVREVMPDPFPPLAWDIWKETVLPTIGEPLFGVRRSSPLFGHVIPVDLVNGRVHWNMNGLLALPIFGGFLRGLLQVIDARAAEVTRRLLATGVLLPRRLPGARLGLSLAMLGASVGSTWGLLRGLFPRRVMRLLMEAGDRAACRPPVGSLADPLLLEELRIFESAAFGPLRNGMQSVALGVLVLGAAEAAFRKHPEARARLASGIAGNPTTDISIGVDGLTAAARPLAVSFEAQRAWPDLRQELQDSSEGRRWLEALAAFLARYGQRCPGEFDLTVPRWAEDPSMIVELVRSGLSRPAAETVATRLERLGRERWAAVDRAAAAAPFWQRPLLRALAWRLEAYMPLREAPKHAAMFFFQRVRAAALEVGSRLVERRLLGVRDDVFFLRLAELQALFAGAPPAADLAERIAGRRETFARFHDERSPDFLRSDGVPVEATAPPADEPGVFHGAGASHGRVSGPVRVLRFPDPTAMRDGDVIVVEFADPGWTPLFPRAAAVVMEVGGVMCHAAVVARELGIPAVFGVTGATSTLRDGQTVEIDGGLGTVTVRS
jgi:pyruvate,water dikinase